MSFPMWIIKVKYNLMHVTTALFYNTKVHTVSLNNSAWIIVTHSIIKTCYNLWAAIAIRVINDRATALS